MIYGTKDVVLCNIIVEEVDGGDDYKEPKHYLEIY